MDIRQILTTAILLSGISLKAMVCHVDGGFQGKNYSGNSWKSAYPDIQEAIDMVATNGGGEVWIKAGIYKPEGNGRQATFKLRPGVRLYGGFRGTETAREARNPKANRTILSGDIGRISDRSDNSYHVLTAASHSRIDGFIISGGNANGQIDEDDGYGGGLLLPDGTQNFIAAHCTFEKNNALLGGGIHAQAAELQTTNCTFYSNSAENGGALTADGTAALRIQNSVFSSNFAPQSGGAVSMQNGTAAKFTHTSFLYNSSSGNGGALHASNATVALSECTFNRNASSKGAAAIAAQDGATIKTNACTYTDNQSAKGISNTFADEISAISEGILESVAQQTVRESTPPPEAQPKTKRPLPELIVLKPDGSQIHLRDIVAKNRFTVLSLGDLTDPAFIKHYRDIEAAARDYEDNGVGFVHIYRHLAHPENHSYVQPFTDRERRRHAELAAELLHTSIPWLVDPIENPTAKALVTDSSMSVFIYNHEGLEEYAGVMPATEAFRIALGRLAGKIAAPTLPENLPAPAFEPFGTPATGLVEQVEIDLTDRFVPLKITPKDSKQPFYVKARIEGTKELLGSGDGHLYLGFHIDPIYNVKWNNHGEPMKYAVKTPIGVAAPSIDSAPRIVGHATDTEPRSFRLEARKLDPAQPLALQLSYSVYSATLKRPINVTQQYLIHLEHDRFAGQVFGRQTTPEGAEAPRPAQPKKTRFDIFLSRMDLDLDGKISTNEANGPVQRHFSELDTNGNGFVEREEYLDYKKRNS